MLSVTVLLRPLDSLGTTGVIQRWTVVVTKQLPKEFLQTHTLGSVSNHAHLKCKTKIQDISAALISAGYLSLDAQAQALGLCREHCVDHCSGNTQARSSIGQDNEANALKSELATTRSLCR